MDKMGSSKKDINLLPVSEFEKSLPGKVFAWALNLGRYIVIGTELIVLIAFLSRFKLDMDLSNLNESIKEKQAVIESYGDLEDKVRFLQKRVKEIKEEEVAQLQSVEILQSLSEITPTDIYLTELQVTKGSFSAQAIALSNASLNTFLAGLQKKEEFNDINLTSLSTGGSESPEIKFSLTAGITR